jgi:3-dehydrosphinganine reductase
MENYQGKLALITGGSSGIGLALAKLLARKGASVTILARKPERLEAARKEIEQVGQYPQQSFGTIAVDVSDADQVKIHLDEFISKVGVPDILINSAGVVYPGEFVEYNFDLFQDTLNINLMGAVNITWFVVPRMVERKSGTIVNIGSMLSFLGLYGYTSYCASKYALRGFSDALRIEMKLKGVNVHLVAPADTQTPQLEFESQLKPEVVKELFKLVGVSPAMTPEKVAEAILNGIERRQYIILPGMDSKLIYYATHLLAAFVNPIMDFLMAQALKRVNGKKDKED